MKAFVAIVGLLVLAMVPTVTASETVKAGNYSFTFNMTVPHQIQTKDVEKAFEIKTFDGKMFITDYGDLTTDEKAFPDSTYIGYITKNVSGDDILNGRVYVSVIGGAFVYQFLPLGMEFQSTLNLTQSMDFFKDVKIARIKK